MFKNLIYLTALLLFAKGSLALAAESDQAQLMLEDAKEQSWQPAQLQVPGLSGDIKVFVTDTGEVKFDSINDLIKADAEIVSERFDHFSDMESFQKKCALVSKTYPAYRKLNVPYELKMKVFAPRNQNLEYMIGDKPVTQLATNFETPNYFEVHVIPTADALVFLSKGFDVGTLERSLLSQLRAQRADLALTGEIHFDLSGYEDVVCDLLGGRLKIEAQVYMNYDQAKLQHTTRVSAPEMNLVYEDVRGHFKPLSSVMDSLISGGRYLGLAVSKVELKANLDDAEFVRLSAQIFDHSRGTLRPLDGRGLTAAAANMDKLEKSKMLSQSIYQAIVKQPVFGGWSLLK